MASRWLSWRLVRTTCLGRQPTAVVRVRQGLGRSKCFASAVAAAQSAKLWTETDLAQLKTQVDAVASASSGGDEDMGLMAQRHLAEHKLLATLIRKNYVAPHSAKHDSCYYEADPGTDDLSALVSTSWDTYNSGLGPHLMSVGVEVEPREVSGRSLVRDAGRTWETFRFVLDVGTDHAQSVEVPTKTLWSHLETLERHYTLLGLASQDVRDGLESTALHKLVAHLCDNNLFYITPVHPVGDSHADCAGERHMLTSNIPGDGGGVSKAYLIFTSPFDAMEFLQFHVPTMSSVKMFHPSRQMRVAPISGREFFSMWLRESDAGTLAHHTLFDCPLAPPEVHDVLKDQDFMLWLSVGHHKDQLYTLCSKPGHSSTTWLRDAAARGVLDVE